MLIEESTLNIERKSVVETEEQIIKLMNWKIPNFSVRHFLESLLSVGFATEEDRVYSFIHESHKEKVDLLFKQKYPDQYIVLKDLNYTDVTENMLVFDKIQKVNEKIIR